jgi:predicted house-cleaning noncanonical NTP pyrophosphatase (MazG superfamily)
MPQLARSPHWASGSGAVPLAHESKVGGKGAGLLRLPAEWYPPSLFVDQVSDEAGVDTAIDQLTALYPQILDAATIVRSNMPDESIRDRGRFDTIDTNGDLEAIRTAAKAIVSQAKSEGLQVAGVLLQPLLRRQLHGYLSNDYRNSRESTTWRIEGLEGSAGDALSWNVSQESSARISSLSAITYDQAKARLRQVCRALSNGPHRMHLEWVWDGARVWVVQADRVLPTLGAAPGDQFRPTVGTYVTDEQLSCWRPAVSVAQASDLGFGKLKALREFEAAGAPRGTLWFATAEQLIGHERDFLTDLDVLTAGHVVIRVDVSAKDPTMMLDRSAAIDSTEAAIDWCRSQAHKLMSLGITSDRIGFLAHRYLRARASAWAFAQPGKPWVRVDSIWGTPGGLDWLPHDTAYVTSDPDRIQRSLDNKAICEDVEEDGGWGYRDVPSEWIWRASINDDQLRQIRTLTQRLADQSGRPVNVMWFVGLLDDPTIDCLPWMRFYLDANTSLEGRSLSNARPRPRLLIRDSSDLPTDAYPEDAVLRLAPSLESSRDKDFIASVGTFATEANIPIEIEGSTLGHAYFELRRMGADVATLSNRFQTPKSVAAGKLVRDGIPSRIASKGDRSQQVVATENERRRLLRHKLVEEAIEVVRATDDELIEELADASEVIEALRKAYSINASRLRSRMLEKRRRLGGFSKGIYLISTEEGGPPPPSVVPSNQDVLPGLEDLRPPLHEPHEPLGALLAHEEVTFPARMNLTSPYRTRTSTPSHGELIETTVKPEQLDFGGDHA